jgi:hypothetical protein
MASSVSSSSSSSSSSSPTLSVPYCTLCERRKATVRAVHEGIEMPFCSPACSKAFCKVLRIGVKPGGRGRPREEDVDEDDDEDEDEDESSEDEGTREEKRRRVDILKELGSVVNAMHLAPTAAGMKFRDSNWEKLPAEVRLFILGKLPLVELVVRRNVSHDWARLVLDDSLWKNLYRRIFIERFHSRQTALVMPTWRQQLIASLPLVDLTIIEPAPSHKLIRYMPIRSAADPAIVVELGPAPHQVRVFFHRADLIMSIIRAVSATPNLRFLVSDITKQHFSEFSLPTLLNGPEYTEHKRSSETPPPSVVAFHYKNAHIPEFEDSVFGPNNNWSDHDMWLQPWPTKTTHADHIALSGFGLFEGNMPIGQFEAWKNYVVDSELTYENNHSVTFMILKSLIVLHDLSQKTTTEESSSSSSSASTVLSVRNTDVATRMFRDERVRKHIEHEGIHLFGNDHRNLLILALGWFHRDQLTKHELGLDEDNDEDEFGNIRATFSATDPWHYHYPVPRITRVKLLVDLPAPWFFYKVFAQHDLRFDNEKAQKEWRYFYTRRATGEWSKLHGTPVELVFDGHDDGEPIEANPETDFELVVPVTLSVPHIYEGEDDASHAAANQKFDIRFKAISSQAHAPILRRRSDGKLLSSMPPPSDDFLAPAMHLSWRWNETGLWSLDTDNASAAGPQAISFQEHLSYLITTFYGAGLREMMSRRLQRPLTADEQQYPINVKLAWNELDAEIDVGLLYYFPESKSWCLLESPPQGVDQIYVTEKGGPDMIASKIK